MLNWTQVATPTRYATERYDFLLRVEENGTAKLSPYNDNPAAGVLGNMTMGVGFNLRDTNVRGRVLAAFGLIRNNPALSAQGQVIENSYISQIETAILNMNFSGLNAIMAARATNTSPDLTPLLNRRSAFSVRP